MAKSQQKLIFVLFETEKKYVLQNWTVEREVMSPNSLETCVVHIFMSFMLKKFFLPSENQQIFSFPYENWQETRY